MDNRQQRLLNEFVHKDIISYTVNYKDNYEECIIKSIQEINKDVFTKEELEIINIVINKFKNYKVIDIVDYSHKERAFIETEYKNKIDYSFALDLNEM